jgi:transcriptional regulator with XRE-family HTH domain
MTLRTERAVAVAHLRRRGLSQAQVAERLGISRSYASELETDPTGAAAVGRKNRYRRPCPGWNDDLCGRLLDGSNGRGPNASKLCSACASQQQRETRRYWDSERIVATFRAFDNQFGRQPTATDYAGRFPGGRKRLSATRLDEVDAITATGFTFPHPFAVQREFGSWSAALKAAGFTPSRGGSPSHREPPQPRTHCKYGHEFTEENTYVYRGSRYCRACVNRRTREYRQRKRGLA